MPTFRQLFVADPAGATGIDLDRKAFVARKRMRRELVDELDTYFASLSSRTVVYKGMLTTPQLSEFFGDLTDPRIESALLLVHSRFSTNTFPSWPLAHPYRFVAHNGEINTVQGNQNWMRAREAMLQSDQLPGIDQAFPICTPGSSDTARFDEVLELLHLGGYPLHHAVMMMIPSAWENDATMSTELRDFFRFHASMMEPWDGPASVTFTDGKVIGAVLDRNGLRPSRYWVTDDDLVVMASEVGVIDVDPSQGRGEGPPAAGQDVPDRHRRRADRVRRGDQDDAGGGASGRQVAGAGHGFAGGSPERSRARRVQPRQRAAPPADVRLHPRGTEDPARTDGGQAAWRLSARWAPTRRSPCCPSGTAGVRLLQAAVRPGDEPTARRDP